MANKKASPSRLAAVLACLFLGAALFAGCNELVNSDYDPSLIGQSDKLPDVFKNTTWTTQYDGYEFTDTVLKYGYEGTVKYAGYFTEAKDSGVIIYEYVAGKEQKYYDYDAEWNVTGGPYDPPGKFHAAYFSDLTANTVKLGGAYSQSEKHGCEAATLEAAKTKFASLDAQQKYCGSPGTYTKQ